MAGFKNLEKLGRGNMKIARGLERVVAFLRLAADKGAERDVGWREEVVRVDVIDLFRFNRHPGLKPEIRPSGSAVVATGAIAVEHGLDFAVEGDATRRPVPRRNQRGLALHRADADERAGAAVLRLVAA